MRSQPGNPMCSSREKMEKVLRLNEERMREVAGEPGNVVYEYQFDSPEKEADPDQVIKLAKAVVQERAKLASRNDSQAEVEIKESSDAFALFARTHARIFSMMCEKETNGRSFTVLCQLAKFKRDSDKTGMSAAESAAKVSEFLMGQCGRTPTVEETKKHKAETERAAAASVEEAPYRLAAALAAEGGEQ